MKILIQFPDECAHHLLDVESTFRALKARLIFSIQLEVREAEQLFLLDLLLLFT